MKFIVSAAIILAHLFLILFIRQLSIPELYSKSFFSEIAFLLVLCLGISIWYVVPVFRKSLRQIPFLKAGTVAFVWSVILLGLPVLCLTGNLPLLQIGHYALFFFSLTIPFNIRDKEEDAVDARTLVHLFGDKVARMVGVFTFSLFIFLLVVANTQLLTSKLFWCFAIFSLFILALAAENRPPSYYLLVDGLILLLGILLLIVR